MLTHKSVDVRMFDSQSTYMIACTFFSDLHGESAQYMREQADGGRPCVVIPVRA